MILNPCYLIGTLSCEFEDPQICGYVQDTIGDDFDWTFWSGDTPTSNTGPSVDVTYGTTFGENTSWLSSDKFNMIDLSLSLSLSLLVSHFTCSYIVTRRGEILGIA